MSRNSNPFSLQFSFKMPGNTDVSDQSGNTHPRIIDFPVPIPKGSPEIIKEIREKLYQPECQDLTVVDFSDLAQGCKTYVEFIERWVRFPKAVCSVWVQPSMRIEAG